MTGSMESHGQWPALVVFGFGLLMAAAFIRQFSRRWARPVAVTGLLILGFTAYYRQADFSEGIRTVVDRFIKREQPEVDRTVHDLQRYLVTTPTSTPPG